MYWSNNRVCLTSPLRSIKMFQPSTLRKVSDRELGPVGASGSLKLFGKKNHSTF